MRVLLDNCVPRKLARHLSGHQTDNTVKLGWADLDDGPLLDVMTGLFDVLLTVDKSIPYQQSIAHRPLALVVLRAKSNSLHDLLPLVPELLAVLPDLKPGEVRIIGRRP